MNFILQNEFSYLFSTNYERLAKMIDWMVGVRANFSATETNEKKKNAFSPKIHGIRMIHSFNLWFFMCVPPLDLIKFRIPSKS